MAHLAIVKVDGNNRVQNYQVFGTEAEALAHVARVIGAFPDAYAAADPGGNYTDWLCDTVAKTVVVSRDLTVVKREKIAALGALVNTKLALGWVFSAKTYQCSGDHLANMDRYMNAYNYFWATVPAWATLTAYVAGDIRRSVRVFYKCAENHTSGDFATDLAAGKWTVWYFHPFKGGDGKWRDKDNAMNALTTEQARTMCEGAINYNMAVRAQAVVHKDAIIALSTVNDVTAYDITAGWPANT